MGDRVPPDTTKASQPAPEPAPVAEAEGREAGKGLSRTEIRRTSPHTSHSPRNRNPGLRVQTGPGPSVPEVSPGSSCCFLEGSDRGSGAPRILVLPLGPIYKNKLDLV